MSHTNSTANYGLPQFITTDKPAWLTDVNVAYAAIDTGMKANQTAAAAAQGDATQALSDASDAATTANAANSKASGAINSISEDFSTTSTYSVNSLVMYNNLLYRCTTAVTTPGSWTGTSNWERVDIDGLYNALRTTVNTQGSQITSLQNAISGLVKRHYFIGTTTANNNLDISSAEGFNPASEIIIAVSAREAIQTSYPVVATPYTYNTADDLGKITGLKCKSSTEGRNIANTLVDGYFWTIPKP